MDGQGQWRLFCVFYHNRSIINRLEYFVLVFCDSLQKKTQLSNTSSLRRTINSSVSLVTTAHMSTSGAAIGQQHHHLVDQDLPLAHQVLGHFPGNSRAEVSNYTEKSFFRGGLYNAMGKTSGSRRRRGCESSFCRVVVA